MVHGNVGERRENVAGSGSCPNLMGKEKWEWIVWVASEGAKDSPYEEQENPAWLSFPCIKKINGKRQSERVMRLIMGEGGGSRAVIIYLIKEQNGFYLSKELGVYGLQSVS